MTHLALQAGHSYRCLSSSRRASFTRRTSCSGRSIPESFTASRDADRNSSASEFPAGQNSVSWSRVIGSLRSTPIPSVFAGGSVHLLNTSGAFYPGHYWMTLNLEHTLIGNWICPLSNDYPHPGTGWSAWETRSEWELTRRNRIAGQRCRHRRLQRCATCRIGVGSVHTCPNKETLVYGQCTSDSPPGGDHRRGKAAARGCACGAGSWRVEFSSQGSGGRENGRSGKAGGVSVQR
jgi:hypothetical protein